jgi:hypothetical protein
MLAEDRRLRVAEDHLAWFVSDVAGGLDGRGLRSLGVPGKGGPGYDPVLLAVLLAQAYLEGERPAGL